MKTHANKAPQNKNHSRPNAVPFEQGGGKSTFQFTDNRPEAIAQRKLQESVNNSARVRQLSAVQEVTRHSPQTRKSFKSQKAIQCDFRDNAIEKIHSYAEKEEESLDQTVCGNSARLIYAAVSEGKKAAGSGTGIDSLTTAMTDAEGRKDQVFIFFVDADIVGHFFTILQNGKTATIMQGYLDTISIAQNISERGGGRQLRNTGELKADLRLLVALRDRVKNDFDWRDPDKPDLVELGTVHTRLFGPGTNAEERLWIKKNILRKKGDDLTWTASFAEGIGEALKSAPDKKGLPCFLTTACTQYMGLPDDCEALTTLRAFRDGYISKLKDGPAMIAEYYRIAPEIVQGIYARPEAEADWHWSSIYEIIRSCVDAIQNEHNNFAYESYKSMVLHLKEQFIQPALLAKTKNGEEKTDNMDSGPAKGE